MYETLFTINRNTFIYKNMKFVESKTEIPKFSEPTSTDGKSYKYVITK